MPIKFSLQMSLLVIYKILGLLVNTLATDGKSTLINMDNLMQQIQIPISKKESLSRFFFLYS